MLDRVAPQAFEIRPSPSGTGAEVIGIDLARPLSAEDFKRISDAFNDYSVLVYRDQKLTPEQHIAFAQCFGEIDVNRFFAPGARLPDDRRGAQGAGAAAQYREWLAHRPFL